MAPSITFMSSDRTNGVTSSRTRTLRTAVARLFPRALQRPRLDMVGAPRLTLYSSHPGGEWVLW